MYPDASDEEYHSTRIVVHVTFFSHSEDDGPTILPYIRHSVVLNAIGTLSARRRKRFLRYRPPVGDVTVLNIPLTDSVKTFF